MHMNVNPEKAIRVSALTQVAMFGLGRALPAIVDRDRFEDIYSIITQTGIALFCLTMIAITFLFWADKGRVPNMSVHRRRFLYLLTVVVVFFALDFSWNLR